MKICVISFDFWQYDGHIVEVLRSKGITAHHINLGAYRHKNLQARVKNTISKVFLGKNLKKHYRQELILDTLKKLGPQDQILVINPEQIERKYHEIIKKYTDRYVAYLYDSLSRNPAEHVLDLFDKIFSFDKNDSARHGFQLITNYNYLPEQQISAEADYDLVYLSSFDNRLALLYKITARLKDLGRNYYYVIVGKKTWIKNLQLQGTTHSIYTRKRIKHEELPGYYKKGRVILDLIRDHQDGLSFRIFEAMALKKKVITNNKTIKDYDLYDANNILILEDDLSNLTTDFFESEYRELPREIYKKYTLTHWVDVVFELK